MPSRPRLSAALRDVGRLDRSRLAFGLAARDALGVTIPLALGAASGHLGAGQLVSLGAFHVAQIDRPGSDRETVRWMAAASAGAAVSVFVGAKTSNAGWLTVALAAAWAFAAGLLVALGEAASQAGLVSVVMLLVLGGNPPPPGLALAAAGAVLLGGLLMTLLALVPCPASPSAAAGATGTAGPDAAPLPSQPGEVLRASLTRRSPVARHAVRLAVCVAVAAALARGLELPRGYWAPMTAALVLEPEIPATIGRGLVRLLGTALGLALGTLLLSFVLGEVWGHVALYGLLVWLLLAFGPGNYLLLVVAATGIVVVNLALAGVPPAETIRDRAVATLLGGAVVLAVSAAWPPPRPVMPFGR